MNTYDLILKFLISEIGNKKDLRIYEYDLNGSKINIRYSFNPEYDWDLKYISYENSSLDLLDYISFLHTIECDK